MNLDNINLTSLTPALFVLDIYTYKVRQ